MKLGKYYSLLLLLMGICERSHAQLASAKPFNPLNTIIDISFGAGSDDLNNLGPPLPAGMTSFKYTTDLCPREGYYALMRRTNIAGCYNNTMRAITIDHTFTDNNGYMMVVNDTTTPYNKILFADTIHQPTCNNSMYEFSAAILNINDPDYCSIGTVRNPGFIFSIESLSGQVLRSWWSGRIASSNATFQLSAYGASVYGFDFTMPAGTTDYVVKIIDSATGNGSCGYAFAVDDIKFLSLGPAVTIGLPGLSSSYFVTSVCYQDGKTVTIDGSMAAGYADPVVQWEQSKDSGLTWKDIPGATTYDYTTPQLSIPDTLLFRLRGSESFNIGDPYCGSVSNIIKVQVDGPPANASVTNNSPVCTDADLIFVLKGGASYITTGPNGFFDDSPFPHIYHPALADSGKYYVKVVSEGGCSVTDSTVAKIVGPPVALVSTEQAICYGKTTQLQASGGNTYSWSPSTGLSDPGIASPLAKPLRTTTYTVKVTDGTGCSGKASVTVKLLDSLLAAKFTGPDIVCPRDLTQFADMSVGSIVSWNWDFGNGQAGNSQNAPQQKYPSAGRETPYSIRLIVTDTAGCADTVSHIIQSVNNCTIDVPSAFTPDGDGRNDYLYPLNAWKATNLVFRVFNRNGQRLFETRDWTNKWDGRVGGVMQQPGVFVWTLDYTDANGKRVSLKGTTILIR